MLSASFLVCVRRVSAEAVGQPQNIRAVLFRPTVSSRRIGHYVKAGMFGFQSGFLDVNGGVCQGRRIHRAKIDCGQE